MNSGFGGGVSGAGCEIAKLFGRNGRVRQGAGAANGTMPGAQEAWPQAEGGCGRTVEFGRVAACPRNYLVQFHQRVLERACRVNALNSHDGYPRRWPGPMRSCRRRLPNIAAPQPCYHQMPVDRWECCWSDQPNVVVPASSPSSVRQTSRC